MCRVIYILVASPDHTETEIANNISESERHTCTHILRQAVRIFEKFCDRLQKICYSIQKFPIKQIVSLFPKIEQAEHDIQLLELSIDPTVMPQLVSVVSFWKNRSRINDVCMGLINLSDKVSVIIDSNLINSVRSITEETCGDQCISIYQQYQNQIEEPYQEHVLTLISHYSSSADFFDFLHSLTANDVYNLQEAVNDWDEEIVNTKTIFDFATVKNFIDRACEDLEVKHKSNPLQLEHVVNCFMEVWKNNQFTNLLKCLESSSLALSSIKRIHLELTDKEQSKRRRITDILQKSYIHFIHIKDHESIFDINIELPPQLANKKNESKQQSITFADLSELRDRTRLLEYSSNAETANRSQGNRKDEKGKLRDFIQYVGIIESTLDILTSLYTAGYPSVQEFLKPQKTFSCIDGVYDDLKENNINLNKINQDWDNNLRNMYEKYISLTYFSHDQLWQIEDHIHNRLTSTHPGYHLLKFIDVDPNSIAQAQQEQLKPKVRLENLGRLLEREGMSSFQGENPTTKQCLLVETTNEGILRAILSLFSLTKTLPKVHHIFYCTTRTRWIQVRAFVYRCFYSQSLHQLIRPELLSQSIQDQFILQLRLLIHQRRNHLFRMGIVTTSSSSEQQMINGLQSMQVLKVIRDYELLDPEDFQDNIKQLIRKCSYITSRIAGLGKSSTIRQDIRQLKKNYIKFPIYGDFDSDTLAKRLCSIHPKLQSAAIHFDIGNVENSHQLNELLYCLLLFGSFRFGQVAFTLPRETPVYVELDSSPQSTLNELMLLHHRENVVYFNEIDWRTLNVDDDKIQTVAGYLNATDNRTIMKQDISPSDLKKFDIATCSRLVQKPFLKNKNTDFITWTQLSIFVAVFYHLFMGFSKCPYFSCKFVPSPKVRMDLVQTLLQSSNQFTSLSVEAVRKQQRSVATNESLPFSDAIVRWDKMQPFTLVFTATNDPLFVYKKPADVPRTLVEYFELYHKATEPGKQLTESEMFPDYTKFNHVQFFIRLASLSPKYFNKAICPKCFRQYQYQELMCQRCSTRDALMRPATFDSADVELFQINIAERLQNEYVLTPDNFIKMLLIYMRVQSGIPVLIMGETGKREGFMPNYSIQ